MIDDRIRKEGTKREMKCDLWRAAETQKEREKTINRQASLISPRM